MKSLSDKRHEVFPWLIGFLIWPLAAFVASWKFMGQKVFSLMLILFYALYGFTFIVAGKEQDTYRTSQYFKEASTLSIGGLVQKLANLYTVGAKPDIFQDILQFSVARITDNVQIYFMITAILFAVVVARVFKVVFKRYQSNTHSYFFIFAIAAFLLLVLSPGRINSFRHYMAGAIFLLAVYNYLGDDSRVNLILLLITPLIHFGFVLVLPLIFIYKIVGNRLWFYYLLAIGTFFVSSQASEYLREALPSLDESSLKYHATTYTSQLYLDRVHEIKTQRYFVLDTYTYFTTLFFFGLMIYHSRFVKAMDRGTLCLFMFSFLMFSFVNAFSELESVSNRFGVLYQGLCCVVLLRYYLSMPRVAVPRYIQGVLILVLAVNAVIVLRLLAQSASVSTLTLLLPISIISPIEISILDLIK